MTAAPETIETTLPVRRPPGFAEPPKHRKIFVSTPMYGGMCTFTYCMSIAALARELPKAGVDFELSVGGGEALITRGRNRAVAEFLASDCTHLLFIDADVGFRPNDVASLIVADEDCVCGAYPLKKINWKAVELAVKGGTPRERLAREAATYPINLFPEDLDQGRVKAIKRHGRTYVEVQDAATGFLLISRELIVKIIRTFSKSLEYTTDYEPMGETHWKVFHADNDPSGPRDMARSALEMAALSGDLDALKRAAIEFAGNMEQPPARYLSEDYWFSRLAQMVGAKIWLCLDVELSHTGQYVFRGDLDKVIPFAGASRENAQVKPTATLYQTPEDKLYTPEWYRSHYPFRNEYHAVADVIVNGMVDSAKVKVLDVGCGAGLMLERWVARGIDAKGVDASPAALDAAPPSVKDRIKVARIEGLRVGEYDVVTCFEVAEHMHAKQADELCETLAHATRAGGMLYFTAATPGQGGHGHVNEQPKAYWIAKLQRVGFEPMFANGVAPAVAAAAPHMPWLGHNLMVFQKVAAA